MTDILSRADLIAQGLDAHEIRRHLKAGNLTRVRRGFYRWTTPIATEDWAARRTLHRQRLEAAIAAADSPVIVSHASAAVVHGLPVPYKQLQRVHLIQPSRTNGRHRAGARRTTAPVDDQDVIEVETMSVTTLPRTLVDLGRHQELGWAVAAMDEAVRNNRCSRSMLTDALSRCRGLPGVVRARRAVHVLDPRSESVGESLSRVLFMEAGIAPDTLQREFPHSEGTDRVDMWWSCGVIGEFDGKKKYLSNHKPGMDEKEAVWHEKVREDRLRRQGYIVVRWTWDDLIRRPDEVIRWVTDAIMQRRGLVA